MSLHLAIAVFVLGCGGPPQTHEEPAAASAARWARHRLLEGRLSIETPPGSELEPNPQPSAMGAAPDPFVLTRMRVPLGAAEVVVSAQELFAMAPEDVRADIEKNLPEGAEIRTLREVGGFAVVHDRRPMAEGELLLADVFAIQPDRTMQRVQFVTWDAEPEVVEAARKGVARMLGTLALAGTKMNTAAGPRVLAAGLPDDQELFGDLPEGAYVSHERGADFQVTYVAPLRMAGEAAPRLGIYLGQHPDWLHQSGRAPDDQVRRESAPLLGETREWRVWERSQGEARIVSREAMAKLSADGTLMHVFVQGLADDPALEELAKVAQGLGVRPATKIGVPAK